MFGIETVLRLLLLLLEEEELKSSFRGTSRLWLDRWGKVCWLKRYGSFYLSSIEFLSSKNLNWKH